MNHIRITKDQLWSISLFKQWMGNLLSFVSSS